jgi:hypothetical protein
VVPLLKLFSDSFRATVKVEPEVVESPVMGLPLPMGMDWPWAELTIWQVIVVVPDPDTTSKDIPPTDKVAPLAAVQFEDRVSWN